MLNTHNLCVFNKWHLLWLIVNTFFSLINYYVYDERDH